MVDGCSRGGWSRVRDERKERILQPTSLVCETRDMNVGVCEKICTKSKNYLSPSI